MVRTVHRVSFWVQSLDSRHVMGSLNSGTCVFYSHPVTPRQLNKITVMTTISDDQAYLLTHRGVQGL